MFPKPRPSADVGTWAYPLRDCCELSVSFLFHTKASKFSLIVLRKPFPGVRYLSPPMATVMASEFVLEPQITLLPQTTLKPLEVLEPQHTELPQRTACPVALVPQITELPQTTAVPHTTELPQTTAEPFTRYTCPVVGS